MKSFFGFESAVEKLAVKHYSANIAKGKEVLEFFIEELIKSGTTYIPPFEETINKSPTDSAIDLSKNHDEDTDASSETNVYKTAREEDKHHEEKKKTERRQSLKLIHQNSATTSGVRSNSFDEGKVNDVVVVEC